MSRLRTMSLRVLGSILMIAMVIALSACSSGSAANPSSTAPTQSPQATSAAPTIELVSPVSGSTVPSGDVAMSVRTTGLKFVMASNTNVAGEGHVHFTLDDEPFEMSVTPDYVYADVAPGEHKLVAELVQNDTTPFSPPVKQEITFTAE